MAELPSTRSHAALENVDVGVRQDAGRGLLADSIKLQQTVAERSASPGKGGRRRKQVVDLDARTVKPSRGRRRAFFAFLFLEATIAVIGVAALIAVIAFDWKQG